MNTTELMEERKHIWRSAGLNPDNYSNAVGQAMQEYAEAYHAARIQEQGEAFPLDEVSGLLSDYIAEEYGAKAIQKYLNTRAAEYAAGKVAGMYTEGQVIEAIRMARKGFDNGEIFCLEDLFGTTEVETIGIDYMYSEGEIINQIKQSK